MAQAILSGVGIPLHSADPSAELARGNFRSVVYADCGSSRWPGQTDGLPMLGTRGEKRLRPDSIASTESRMRPLRCRQQIDQMRTGSAKAYSQPSISWE